MCGIFGYVGASTDAARLVQEGLQRLEYRGYDSWGVAVLDHKNNNIEILKKTGEVTREELSLTKGTVAIGHTRWATHGAVTNANAHPHAARDGSFVLAHNGIVENHEALRSQLKSASYFSQTDTEVIVRLIEKEKGTNMASRIRSAFKKLTGRNTIIVLTKNGDVHAIRNGSPLVVGTNTKNEIFFSSDSLSLGSHVDKIAVIENGTMISCVSGKLSVHTIDGKSSALRFEPYRAPRMSTDKGAYAHYMIKEIHDTPTALAQIISDKRSYTSFVNMITKARTVYCIGSGTAGVAAQQMAFYLRTIAGVRAVALIGGEASDYHHLIGSRDLCIAPSQSGETADVLEILERAKKNGARIASYINMYGSMMTRMSDFPFMADAGPEICVMSTKIFTSQIAWGYLLAHRVAGSEKKGVKDLRKLIEEMQKYLTNIQVHKSIQTLAKETAHMPHLFLMAKGQNAAIIREGMVKIIEGSYVHAHALPAGDLKHYAITLIEKDTPVLALVSDDVVRSDVENAIHEVKARGARVLTIGSMNDATLRVPETEDTSAIMHTLPLQLLAYYMAVARGTNVDKPRNIAKSVTVK